MSRVIQYDGRLFRFAQDCAAAYGRKVRAFQITTLTPTEYSESSAGPGPFHGDRKASWNADGMHHIDAHRLPDGRWLAVVDGWHWGQTGY